MKSNLTIRELITNAQKGDKDASIQLIDRLAPLTKKYSRRLGYDDAYADLIMWLVWAIKNYKIPNPTGIN